MIKWAKELVEDYDRDKLFERENDICRECENGDHDSCLKTIDSVINCQCGDCS